MSSTSAITDSESLRYLLPKIDSNTLSVRVLLSTETTASGQVTFGSYRLRLAKSDDSKTSVSPPPPHFRAVSFYENASLLLPTIRSMFTQQ